MRALNTQWRSGQRGDSTRAAGWLRALPVHPAIADAVWDRLPRKDDSEVVTHGTSVAADASPALSPWSSPPKADAGANLAFGQSVAADSRAVTSAWERVLPKDRDERAPWERALPPALRIDPPPQIIGGQPLVPGYTAPTGSAINISLEAGYQAPLGDRVGNVEIIDPPPYIVYRKDPLPWAVVWGRSSVVDLLERVRWGHGPQLGPRDPPPIDIPNGNTHEPPPTPDPEKVYVIMNSVQVVTLPDRVPIHVLAVDVEASVDSWCWAFRMELGDPAQRALLKATADGPKSVEITINGYVWTGIVEGRDGTRAHPSEGARTATVNGRSQTALLSDSYTAPRTHAELEQRTAQQLALGEITDRSLPFTIDWDGLDWLVPGGVFSYQDMAPIDVIAQIAAARGAVLLSAPGDATLIVRSRYPASPWAWSAESADITLPIDWSVDESAQEQNKPLYDAVFVSGQQQGVTGRVTREFAAGETWAAQVVDPLITTADVARERGRTILSDRGMQDLVQHQIPLFPPGDVTAGATGLYSPLLLVNVADPDDPFLAIAVAVSISARRSGDGDKALEVWQTVSLERHMSDAS